MQYLHTRRLVLSLFLLGMVFSRVEAGPLSLDSVANWPVVAAPIVTVSPETGWTFGAAAQGYFRLPNQSRLSIVQLDGSYSLRRQWYVNTSGSLYFGKDEKWLLNIDMSYRRFPDLYYRPGNALENKEGVSYKSDRHRLHIQPLYRLPKGWAVGVDAHYVYEKTDTIATGNFLGMGVVGQFDSRDVQFYPMRGCFFKAQYSHYFSLNSNYHRYELVRAEFRHFVPLGRRWVFAWQARTDWTIGTDVPFYCQPTLGGQDLLRGVRAGMYRDDVMAIVQTELRFPIWKILHGVCFASVGDTYHLEDWKWNVPKVGYGLGLRASINQAGINIRVDVARNNIVTSWLVRDGYMFYITATEAF